MEIYHDVHVPDFIVRRKWKRPRAVDPCLGFYVSSPSPPAVQTVEGSQSVSRTPVQFQAIKPADASQPTGSDMAVITVEDFLRRSAERPTKNYSRKRRRVDLVTYQVPSLQPSVEGEDINDRRQPGNGCKRRQVSLTPQTPSSSSPYQASSVSNNMRRRPQSRKAKSLAQRIIAAAVLSHVNPHKDIASATSSRHPLPLVSGHRGLASPSGVVRKHQTRNLVDPRKTVPFRQATFSSGTCRDHLNTPRTTRQKPLTKWNTVYDPETPGKLRSRKARNPQGVQQRALHCPPLRFIPVHDAEQAYASKVLLSGRNPDRTADFTRNRNPEIPFLPVDAVKPQTPTVTTHQQAVRFSSAVLRTPNTSCQELQSTYPSTVDAPWSPDVTVSESLNELNSVSNMPVIPSNVVNELAVPSSPTIPGKPLKALAFFLDSFLETARSAAQRQASTVSQHGSVNHKEQRRSTLTRENLEQIALDVPDANPKKYTTVPILQPISSMKSFVPSSIRNVHSSSDQVRLMLSRSSVLPPPLYPEVKPIPSHIGNAALSPHLLTTSPISSLTNTPLESLLPQKDDDSRSSIRKNSKQRTFSPLAHSSMQNARIKVGMGRKMSRPVFDLPSGQDILKTLQPQPYQILLPTPHRYRFLSNDLDLDDLEMDPLTSPIDLFAGFGYSLSPAVS